MTRQGLTPLSCPPLYGTPRTFERPTLGPRIAEIAEYYGKPLQPWQRHVVDVASEIDPDTGYLAYDQVVIICMRQQGKTELMLPVMTHRCIGYDEVLAQWVRRELGKSVVNPGPQRVLYTAQTADFARNKWRDVHVPRILAAPQVRRHLSAPGARMGGIRLRTNAEAIFWKNGSAWSPGSTTGKTGGTGDTLDTGVIDEAWSREDSRTELSLRPAMLTRHWRQLWVISMIPGLSRVLPHQWRFLADKRKVGRSRVEADVRHGMAFFDFSARDGLDPADPETWWGCMPALASGLIPEAAVRSDFDAMDLVDFCAEYLGWAPKESVPKWTVISRSTWADRFDPASQIFGESALAAEISEDRDRGVIGAAGLREDGQWHVEVVEPGDRIPLGTMGVEWMLPRLIEMAKERGNRVCTVVIDKRRPAGSLVTGLKNAGVDVTTPNTHEVAASCGRFFDLTGQEHREDDSGQRLFHIGQPELDQAIAGARKLDLGEGSFTFVKKGSVSEISALYTVVLAIHGHLVKSGRIRRSAVF